MTNQGGPIPYRLGLAGGWIDQPFVSRHDPEPPGSMVVVGIRPTQRFLERAGLATSTRRAALRLWPDGFPDEPADRIVRRLYDEENRGKAARSGSQDMIGLVVPGISRLDYDFAHEGGRFPVHVETTTDPDVAAWLQRVLHVIPLGPRPPGYDPLARRTLDPKWVRRLGRSGADCWSAIVARDAAALGASFNDCMECWSALLPSSFSHATLSCDLREVLRPYRDRYAGAKLAASGGGYLFVVSERPVPGSVPYSIRLD